jgi:hypothetical protein
MRVEALAAPAAPLLPGPVLCYAASHPQVLRGIGEYDMLAGLRSGLRDSTLLRLIL